MALTKRQFLTIGAIGTAGAIATVSKKPREIAKNALTDLLDYFFLEPQLSKLTYREVLPAELIKTVEGRIGTFGFAELLARQDLFERRADGIYFIKPQNAQNYDCVVASREISDIIGAHTQEIPGYLEHTISSGIDEKGINPLEHFWVSLLIKRDGRKELVNIDLTYPYKGTNPKHLEQGVVKKLSDDNSINLNGVVITSSYWQGTDSSIFYTSGIGVKDGRFVVYRLNVIPFDPSENVLQYELVIDPKSKGHKISSSEIVANKQGYPDTNPMNAKITIFDILKLMPSKDFAALNTVAKVYIGKDLSHLRK